MGILDTGYKSATSESYGSYDVDWCRLLFETCVSHISWGIKQWGLGNVRNSDMGIVQSKKANTKCSKVLTVKIGAWLGTPGDVKALGFPWLSYPCLLALIISLISRNYAWMVLKIFEVHIKAATGAVRVRGDLHRLGMMCSSHLQPKMLGLSFMVPPSKGGQRCERHGKTWNK